MAFKNYSAASTANTNVTVFTTPTGKTTLILSAEIAASAASDVTIKYNNGTADYFSQTYNLSAGDIAVIDHKIIIPAGYLLIINATTANVKINCNVLEM